MSDNKSASAVSVDFTVIAIAILFIAFWDEPDLVDALIYWLMK